MLTIEAVQEMLENYPGAKWIFVLDSGKVRRDVFLTKAAYKDDRPALYGLVDDHNTNPGKVEAYLYLEEIIFWELDPRDWSKYFNIQIFDEGKKRIVLAYWEHGSSHAYSDNISEAIHKLKSGNHSNPPDCNCEHIHCSHATCRSIAPSRGAVPESERIFPVEARV